MGPFRGFRNYRHRCCILFCYLFILASVFKLGRQHQHPLGLFGLARLAHCKSGGAIFAAFISINVDTSLYPKNCGEPRSHFANGLFGLFVGFVILQPSYNGFFKPVGGLGFVEG